MSSHGILTNHSVNFFLSLALKVILCSKVVECQFFELCKSILGFLNHYIYFNVLKNSKLIFKAEWQW